MCESLIQSPRALPSPPSVPSGSILLDTESTSCPATKEALVADGSVIRSNTDASRESRRKASTVQLHISSQRCRPYRRVALQKDKDIVGKMCLRMEKSKGSIPAG